MVFAHPAIALIGLLILIAAAYDAARTTLSPSSSGPLTNFLTSRTWWLLLRLHRLRPSPSLLGGAGTWITLALILAWLLAFWLGWVLVFCGSVEAVVNSTTRVPADWAERVYFVGYTLTTLGYGDMVPAGRFWKVVAIGTSANGLLLFTMSITYAIPIVSSATQKRQLALCIHAIGESPQAIVQNMSGKGDFESLTSHLQGLQGMIAGTSQKHLAYPVLHYFHSQSDDFIS